MTRKMGYKTNTVDFRPGEFVAALPEVTIQVAAAATKKDDAKNGTAEAKDHGKVWRGMPTNKVLKNIAVMSPDQSCHHVIRLSISPFSAVTPMV